MLDPRLSRRVGAARRYLVAAAAIGAASTICLVAQAAVLGLVVQRVVIEHRKLGDIEAALVVLALTFALRAVLAWLAELAAQRTSATVVSTLRRQLLAEAVRRGPQWLAGERTGELTAATTQGVDALESYFGRYLPAAVVAAVAPPSLLVWMLWRDWPSAAVLAVTVAVIPVFMTLLGLEARRRARAQWERLAGLSAAFYDIVNGLPTLRALGRQEAGRRTLARSDERLRRTTMATLRVAFLSSFALEVLASVGTALVALFLGLRLLDGTVHLGTALAVLVLAPEVYLPLRKAGMEFHASAEGQAAAQRIFDLLHHDSAEPPPCPWLRPDLNGTTVRLHDVTVVHPDRLSPVFDHVDLVVEPGEHLLVTGASGAGKSTLLGVLLGFTEVSAGSVTAGGADRSAIDPAWWHRQVGWVPQRPYLVRGTIAENLRLALPNADESELARALRLSGLDEFVARLPLGLDSQVGEGGANLSAGERQRISIARVVLHDAPLVLLDEPTAHLDLVREEGLAASLGPWLDGRTVVAAAHRTGLLQRVDRTLQIVDGALLEVSLPPDVQVRAPGPALVS